MVTLKTKRTQKITATDKADKSISGNASVKVSTATPAAMTGAGSSLGSSSVASAGDLTGAIIFLDGTVSPPTSAGTRSRKLVTTALHPDPPEGLRRGLLRVGETVVSRQATQQELSNPPVESLALRPRGTGRRPRYA